MLDQAGMRYKVVIISACYSGVFIPHLATADTLVIHAADAKHPSFGCEDRAKWTYFGDAFFNAALRQSATLRDAFTIARAGCVDCPDLMKIGASKVLPALCQIAKLAGKDRTMRGFGMEAGF
jgi:Peptidase C13 family